jgi:hypothetical protein
VWTPEQWVSQIVAQGQEDPTCLPANSNMADISRCIHAETWRLDDMPLVTVIPSGPLDTDQPSYWTAVVAGLVAVWALAGSIRASTARPSRSSTDAPPVEPAPTA